MRFLGRLRIGKGRKVVRGDWPSDLERQVDAPDGDRPSFTDSPAEEGGLGDPSAASGETTYVQSYRGFEVEETRRAKLKKRAAIAEVPEKNANPETRPSSTDSVVARTGSDVGVSWVRNFSSDYKKRAAIAVVAVTVVGVGLTQLPDTTNPPAVATAAVSPQDPSSALPVNPNPTTSGPADPRDPSTTEAEPDGPVAPAVLPPVTTTLGTGTTTTTLAATTVPTTTTVPGTTTVPTSTTSTTTTTTTVVPVEAYAHAQGGPTLCPEYARANQLTRTFIIRDLGTGEDLVSLYDGASATMTLTGGLGRNEQANATVSGATVTFVWTFSPLLETSEYLDPNLQVGGAPMGVSVNDIGFAQGNCTYP